MERSEGRSQQGARSRVVLLRLHPKAQAELRAAVLLFEEERPGSGVRLANQVERRIEQAARFPQSGALVLGFDEELDVRQFVVGSRLPFVIIAALIGDERIAIAIAHTRREPGYWKNRVK